MEAEDEINLVQEEEAGFLFPSSINRHTASAAVGRLTCAR